MSQATDDKMRVALYNLNKAQVALHDAITELRIQGYTTPSAAIQIVLDDLKVETLDAEDRVYTETLG